MKNQWRGFVSGFLVAFLILGFSIPAFAAYQRQATLNYSDIKIKLNGQEIEPKDATGKKVDPFTIDGTTYLPVRAISSAFGLDVDWDQKTQSVLLSYDFLGDVSEEYIRLLGFYKILEEECNRAEFYFKAMLTQSGISDLRAYTASGKTAYEYGAQLLRDGLTLVEEHYISCKDLLSEDAIANMLEYRRLSNLAISQLSGLKNNQTNLQIETLTKVSIQNYIDATAAQNSANDLFWGTYQYYYQ